MCETGLPGETVERLQRLADHAVQGIALCAKDHSAIVDRVNALVGSGVAVVTFNSDLVDCSRLCFVGQQLIKGGRVAGELMSKYMRPNDTLLVAIGNPEFDAHRLRLQGFCERLYEKKFNGNKLELIETYNDYSLTYQKVSETLSRRRDVKGIYMANHSVTGCVEAIRDAGLQGRIRVVCHDLTDSARRFLESGEVDFVIAQNIYQQSLRALVILQEYVQKHAVPDQERECLPIEILCSENMDANLF